MVVREGEGAKRIICIGDIFQENWRGSEGLSVETVPNVSEVLDSLDGIECVVCDVTGGDCQVIRTLREADSTLAILAVGNTDEASRTAALEAGATIYHAEGDFAWSVDRAIELADLRRTQTIIDNLFDDLPAFLYVKDRKGRYVRVSEAAFSTDDFVGNTDVDLLGDAGMEMYEDDLHVVETGEPIIEKEMRVPLFPLDYTAEWISVTKVPWRDREGNILGIVGVNYSIQKQKDTEAQLQTQNERLEEFASVVSHDLRNPLNVAKGYLPIARETGNDQHFDEVERALERIDQLIQDLLTLANKGQSIEEVQYVVFHEIVEEAWNTIDQRNASIEIEGEEQVIEADPGRLRQLFENLFRNAIEHGGEDIDIRAGTTQDGFYVEDDGPGIPEQERTDVFKHGYTTSEDGTGLGLSIVNTIVEAHDWEIEATAAGSGGARFEITGVTFDIARRTNEEKESRPRNERSIDESVDVGNPPIPGSLSIVEESPAFHIEGAGENIWQRINEFHYVYEEAEGDFEYVVRLNTMELNENAKAGIMVRNRLTEHSGFALAAIRNAHRDEVGVAEMNSIATTPEFVHSEYASALSISTQSERYVELPHWLKLVREGDIVAGYASSDGEDWWKIDEDRVKFDESETTYVGLAVSSNSPRVLTSATFDNVSGLQTWENTDIGPVEAAGSAERTKQRCYAVEGTGSMEDGPEAFHFARTTATGDIDVIARVRDIRGSNEARAGVTIRESMVPNARHATLHLDPNGGATFTYRAESVDTVTEDLELPYWIMVTRRNDELTGYVARDGYDWTEIGSHEMVMADNVSIGLFAGGDNELVTGLFDNVLLFELE